MKKSVRKQRKSLRNKRRNTKKHSRKTRLNTKKGGWPWSKTDVCTIVKHAKAERDNRGVITYSFDVKDPEVVKEVGYLTAANPLTYKEYMTKKEECNKIKAEKEQKNQPVIFTLPLASE